MSADKRALDDLDALFRAVPTSKTPSKTPISSSSRPSKKSKNDLTTPLPYRLSGASRGNNSHPISSSRKRNAQVARLPGISESDDGSNAGSEPERMYARILPDLLPQNMRAAPGGARSMKVVGTASAARLTEFIRGLLATRGERAAASLIESRVQRKVLHLENISNQQEAQSAEARAARSAGRVQQGLSRKRCNQKGLGSLKLKNGDAPSFRDLLRVHDLWKTYASRVVSNCKNTPKALEHRILSADLQGSFLTVSRASASTMVGVAGILLRETANTFQIVTPEGKASTVTKRGCEFRFAFGGRVVTLAGRALEGRRLGRTTKLISSEHDGYALATVAL